MRRKALRERASEDVLADLGELRGEERFGGETWWKARVVEGEGLAICFRAAEAANGLRRTKAIFGKRMAIMRCEGWIFGVR